MTEQKRPQVPDISDIMREARSDQQYILDQQPTIHDFYAQAALIGMCSKELHPDTTNETIAAICMDMADKMVELRAQRMKAGRG